MRRGYRPCRDHVDPRALLPQAAKFFLEYEHLKDTKVVKQSHNFQRTYLLVFGKGKDYAKCWSQFLLDSSNSGEKLCDFVGTSTWV